MLNIILSITITMFVYYKFIQIPLLEFIILKNHDLILIKS